MLPLKMKSASNVYKTGFTLGCFPFVDAPGSRFGSFSAVFALRRTPIPETGAADGPDDVAREKKREKKLMEKEEPGIRNYISLKK